MAYDLTEAKCVIKREVMRRYSEWMDDRNELGDRDYGWKYGWQKSERLLKLKDGITAVVFFQKYIFSGATEAGWAKIGVDSRAVWALVAEGWLSRMEGHYKRPTFYYLTQERVKEIYREAKGRGKR